MSGNRGVVKWACGCNRSLAVCTCEATTRFAGLVCANCWREYRQINPIRRRRRGKIATCVAPLSGGGGVAETYKSQGSKRLVRCIRAAHKSQSLNLPIWAHVAHNAHAGRPARHTPRMPDFPRLCCRTSSLFREGGKRTGSDGNFR